MYSLKNISAYILNKYSGQITPMKLQKLLYYVKVWTLVANHKVVKPQEGFYAWKYGPVNPAVYHEYKKFKNLPIDIKPVFQPLKQYDKQITDFILESYSSFSAITLSKTTHAEKPWIINKDSRSKIKDQEIKDYYSQEAFAKNFPLDSSNVYYPPNTISHDSFVFDMEKGDAATQSTFSSLDEYLQQLEWSKEKVQRYMKST